MKDRRLPLKRVPRISSVYFIGRIYSGSDGRMRLPALPKKLQPYAKDIADSDVLISIRSLNKDIVLPIPWLYVKGLKHAILQARDKAERIMAIKNHITIWILDFFNTIIQYYLGENVFFDTAEPKEVMVDDLVTYIVGTKMRYVRMVATGFTLPTGKITNALVVEGEIYDLPDEQDVFAYSYMEARISLRKLIEDIGFKYNVSTM